MTTRKPRIGEKQGIDYISYPAKPLINKNKKTGSLERLFIEMDALDLLIVLTYEGCKAFEREFGKNFTSFFLSPPSEDELRKRKIKRGDWQASLR